jgi:tartronate-semialdehyde synthase
MKMRAAEAAIHVLLREGVTTAFGLPGAAINPVYAAMRSIGSINHILARHVEGASHMPRATRGRSSGTSAYASARQDPPGPT